MKRKWYFIAPLALVAFLAFIALGGEIVSLLWNWLAPEMFGWNTITFWQALGLLALCRILFGGFGFHKGDRSLVRRRIRERMAQRWERMTPEERERFRQGMGGRCGFPPPEGEGDAR
jgi:hypothetical protein